MTPGQLAGIALPLALLCGCGLEGQKPPELKNPPAPFATTEVVKATPELREISAPKDGKIVRTPALVCGDNSLLAENAGLKLVRNGQHLLSVSYWGSTKANYGHPFNSSAPALALDQASKTLSATRKFTTLAPDDSTFIAQAKVLADGLVELDYACALPPGGKLTDRGLFVSTWGYDQVAGTKLQLGDKTITLSADSAPQGVKTLFDGQFQGRVALFADRPDKLVAFDIPDKTFMQIQECRKTEDQGHPYSYQLKIRIQPKDDGALKVLLDMRNSSPESLKTADTFLGVDFWKHDRLHVPAFAASRNLLQNPSFEEDLHYYKDFGWASYPGVDRDVYSVDGTTAFSGKRSLKVKAWKDCKDPSVLATFAIPAVPGKKYTFSFYAKADSPKLRLTGRVVTGAWGTFPAWPSFDLTTDWKRHAATFTAPNNVLCMMFNVANNGDADVATAWVDGLQLEEADQATAYVEPPVAATLLTSKEGNFLASSDPVDARVRIDAAPNTKGVLDCEITDFFYAKPYIGSFAFTTGPDGEAVVKLPLEGKLGRGVFSVRTDVKMAAAAAFTEFHRISVIDPAPASCLNKSVFGALPGLTSRSDFEAARLSYLGIGSCCYTSSEATDKVAARHGIPNSGCGTSDYGPGSYSACVVKDRPALPGRLEKEPYSDSLRDDVRRISSEMVKAYPWIRVWFLQAESNCRKFKCEVDGDYTGYAKLILAAREGVLKADPTLKFMFEGGPSNMSPGGGIDSYDKWLTAAEKVAPDVRFDAFAIHPYRPSPENPDIDADADTYLKMLTRHGYKTEPVYWNEGSYHCPWVVPEWGLNLGFCDQYRCGWFSYHMGWAERVSAAWNARCWLAALKYSDRVRQLVSWGYHAFVFLDAEGTVSALAKAPNTLCRLLGDAKFKKDIRFAVGCRAYVFEDAQGRPVAALWSHIPDVDRGLEPSPVAKMRFDGPAPEFIDFMENQVAPRRSEDGAYEIPVTPFPLFVRGEPGTLDTLCAAIANATLSGTKDFPLAVDMKLRSRTAAELSFDNRISRPFAGEAQAADQNFALSLPEGAKQAFAVTLPTPIPFDKIGRVSLPLKVSENGGESVEKDFSLYAFSTANASAWDAVPWIKLTNRKLYDKANDSGAGDLAAEFKTRWDKDALRLLVKVVDDKARFPQGGNSGGDWGFDSLQIYLDTLGDNANRRNKAIFDFNDYSYCVSRDAVTGKARVWRQNAPEAQVGDAQANAMPNTVVTNIPATVTPTADGYVYEIAFPKWAVSPFVLKAGSFGRLALYVNDNDGPGREGGLVSTVDPDSEPFNNPEQWPGIILTDK